MKNKNKYSYVPGAEGAEIYRVGVGMLSAALMTDEIFEKHIKGSGDEHLFIVEPNAVKEAKK